MSIMEPGSTKKLTGPSDDPLKYVDPDDVAWDNNSTLVVGDLVIEDPTVMQGAGLCIYPNRFETTLPAPKRLDAPAAQPIVTMWKPFVVRAKAVPVMEAGLPLCETQEEASAVALRRAQAYLLESFVENERLGTGAEPLGRWMYTMVNVIEFRYVKAGYGEYAGVALTPKPEEIRKGDLFFINALEYVPTTPDLRGFDDLGQFRNGHIMTAIICDDGEVDVFDVNGPTALKVTCAKAIGKAIGRGFKNKDETQFQGYPGMLVESDYDAAIHPSQQGMCQIISAVQLFSLRQHQLNPTARLLDDLDADHAQDEFTQLSNSNDIANLNRYYKRVRREPSFYEVFGDKTSYDLSTGDAIRQWSGPFYETCLGIKGKNVREIMDDGTFFQGDAVASDGATMAEEVHVFCASPPDPREASFYEVCVTASMLEEITNFLGDDRHISDLYGILRLQFAGHTLPMDYGGSNYVFQASEHMPNGLGKNALVDSLMSLSAYDVLDTVFDFRKTMVRMGYKSERRLKVIQAGSIIGPMHIKPKSSGGAAAAKGRAFSHVVL